MCTETRTHARTPASARPHFHAHKRLVFALSPSSFYLVHNISPPPLPPLPSPPLLGLAAAFRLWGSFLIRTATIVSVIAQPSRRLHSSSSSSNPCVRMGVGACVRARPIARRECHLRPRRDIYFHCRIYLIGQLWENIVCMRVCVCSAAHWVH